MKAHIEAYLNKMEQVSSESTVKNHKSTLNKFAKFVNVSTPVEILARDVKRFKDELLATGKVASANTQIKRLKAFLNSLVEAGILDSSPAEEIGLVAEAEALPKWLSADQEDLLVRAIRKDYLGSHLVDEKKSYREHTMVLLMLKAGLRVSELCNLTWEALNLGERKGTALIRGKFGQQRLVPVVTDVLKALRLYEEKHGRKGDYVFYSQKSERLSERMVQVILAKYVGLSNGATEIKELTPHMLRHTFAHNLASSGKIQIESVARLLGHIKKDGTPNIQQTIRYTKASNDEIFDQVENILAIS